MPVPTPRKNDVCGHYDRRHYAKGQCRPCYSGARQKVGRQTQVRVEKPEVAAHVAGAIVMNNMDVEQAVKNMIAPGLTPAQQADIVDKLNDSPEVKAAVEKVLEASGMDETSKSVFVKRLWEWFEFGGERKAIAAARLLGRGFIGEKIDDKKPIQLQIEGFAEGMKAMMGTPAKPTDVALPTDATPEELADEGEGEGDDEEFDD